MHARRISAGILVIEELAENKKKTLETLLFQGFHACGSNRIRTYDLPGMNRTLWPAELLSHVVAGAGLEPATSGL